MRPADQLGALSLLATGALLGSGGLAILTPRRLELIDPVVPLALAAVGIIAGLDSTAVDRAGARRAAAVAVRSLIPAAIVGAGLALLVRSVTTLAVPAWPLAAVAASGAFLASPAPRPLAIVVAAVVVASLRDGTGAALPLVAQAGAIAGLMALAGWLLMTHEVSPTQRRVFLIATLLLIGGASDYMAMPALFGGLVAGIGWQRAGAGMRDAVQIDLAALQHPLAALLLVVAGALAAFSPDAVLLAVAFALLRLAGESGLRLAAGATRPEPSSAPSLLSPLVFAVAPALTAVRTAEPDLAPALAVVVAGTLLYGLLPWTWPREAAA